MCPLFSGGVHINQDESKGKVMDSAAINKVCQSVYARVPALQGVKPKVSAQGSRYLLIFTKTNTLPTGKALEQTVRVVADEEGNIIKMSSSRG